MQIPIAGGSAIIAPVAGRLVSRAGRLLVVGGTALVTASSFALILSAHEAPRGWLILATGITAAAFGIGAGLMMTPNQALAVEHIPVETGSTAGGLFQTLQRVGSAIGMAIVTLAFYSVLTPADISGPAGRDYPAFAGAFGWGMAAIAAFTALACLVALIDAVRERRH
ncbi:MFS transporter [Nanchangia anserum]|nr:MFS transporter [Nanchangia anserum]QOX81704.1 MFS transporter [Nanchangia anserum]